MPTIRFDNNTDDSVTIFLDGTQYVAADEEKITVSNISKGPHSIIVHRTRIPKETQSAQEAVHEGPFEKSEKSDRSIHTQLDGVFEIDLMSTKSVITIQSKISAVEKRGIDALFSGYKIQLTGAKSISESDTFASSDVKKRFIKYQLKNAFLPAGIGGFVISIIGMTAISANIDGNPLTLGGQRASYTISIGITAVGLACIGYFTAVIAGTISIVKKYKMK